MASADGIIANGSALLSLPSRRARPSRRATEASRLCAEEVELARQWGASRGLGIALRASGMTEGADRGIELLTEAWSVSVPSPARLELARALIDLGAAHRRAMHAGHSA